MPIFRSGLRDRRALAGVLLLLLLAGCAVPTPYQPSTGGYGYTEQQLESNRYRVAFSGNSVTPRDTVQNYLLYRAAELTLDRGDNYFTVVNQNVERSTVYYGTGYGSFGLGRFNNFDNPAFGAGFGTNSYSAYPIDSYTAFADILLAKGEKPAGDVNAYDARDVIRQLGPKIVRPNA
jgi:hypothetical protein